jgi:isocitrate/isopropylmalate dehydrogenase
VEAAALIEKAMDAVIADGRALTGDLGGQGTTRGMGDAVAAAVG